MATIKDFFNNDNNELWNFNLKHGLKYFVETGTGIGESIEFVSGFFDIAYSIEIMPEIYEKAKIRLKGKVNVMLICNDSERGLKQILEGKLERHTEPVLFFLDAHFPGADFGLAEYDTEDNPDIRIPLQKELETIAKLRGQLLKNDCFIIDDLRVYEDGPFEAGNWEHREKLGGKGIEFIYDLFAETHFIKKDYRFQGFIILTPIK